MFPEDSEQSMEKKLMGIKGQKKEDQLRSDSGYLLR